VLNLAFWLRRIPQPSDANTKRWDFDRLANALNAHLKDRPDPNGAMPFDWHTEWLSWYTGEPDRIANMQGFRLTAALPDAWLNDFWSRRIAAAGHETISVSDHKADDARSMFRYENYGLGTLEYVTRFEGSDDDAWRAFLVDSRVWGSIGDLTPIIDNGGLPIQRSWHELREAFEGAYADAGLLRLTEIEDLRGDPPYKLPKEVQPPEEWLPEPKPHVEDKQSDGRIEVPRRRDDDVCWAYSSPLVLYRNPACKEFKKVVQIAHDVFAAFNGTEYIEEKRDGMVTTSVPELDTGLGTLEIVLAQDMSLLAVVTEEPNTSSELSLRRPSRRVRAIWRQVHMHYAALTEATSGVQKFISRAIKARATLESEDNTATTYEQLRRASAVLEDIRFRSIRQHFEADDFEPAVHSRAYETWGVESASAALGNLLDAADRVTSRLNDIVARTAEKRLNRLVAALAVITVLSVMHDVMQYVGWPDPQLWLAAGWYDVSRTGLLVVAVVIAIIFACRAGLGTLRWLDGKR
jgi:hypothetical protein